MDHQQLRRGRLQGFDSEKVRSAKQMRHANLIRARTTLLVAGAAALWLAAVPVQAQRGGGRGAPPNAKAAAPIDLSGYWVSVITEDWRYRMVTPTKGDYQSVPMTQESRRIADM